MPCPCALPPRGGLSGQRLLEPLGYLRHIPLCVDDPQQTAGTVELDERTSLLLVHAQPLGHGGFVVVRTLDEPVRSAAHSARLAQLRRRGRHVEDPPAVGTGASPGNPAHQLAVVDLELYDRVERLAQRLQEPIERLRLGEVAGEAIEDEAAASVRLAQALADHSEHQCILHQTPLIHRLLGLAAELATGGYCRAQQVPGRDLGDVLTLHEPLRLSALTRAGSAQQDDAHGYRERKRLRRQHEGWQRYRPLRGRSNGSRRSGLTPYVILRL